MSKNNNPYSKPSAEEQELWWKEGTKGENFRRLYEARIAKRATWNDRNGVTTTYYNDQSNLPEFTVTAPKETEEQKQKRLTQEEAKRKQEKENLIDLAITGVGFVPGLDVVADIADSANQFRLGNWGWGLVGVLGVALPGISMPHLRNMYKLYKVKKELSKIPIDEEELAYYSIRNMYNKEFTKAPNKYYTPQEGQYIDFPENIGIHQDNNVLDKDLDQAHIDKSLKLQPRKESTDVWYKINRPYYENEFWERIISTPTKDIKGSPISSTKPVYDRVEKSGPVVMSNSTVMQFNPLTGWYERGIFHMPSVQKIESAADFSKAHFNMQLLDQMDNFANKYGYPKSDRSTILSDRRTNKQIRQLIARHNTYLRGVTSNGFEPDDILRAKKILGNNMSEEDFLKYAATHKRTPESGIWISPEENAFIYGGRKNTALVRRQYKLGKNRSKWFEEGDFNIQTNPVLEGKSWNDMVGIVAPWYTPSKKSLSESELLSMENLNFAGWANLSNWKNKVSLNNKVK